MSTEQEISLSNKSENLPLKLLDCFEEDLGNDEVLKDQWLFPRASDHFGTVLRPGVVRPLSPTLKVHSPESVFPGMAMLCEGFDNMCEWKKKIEFVGFFTRKGNMFNRRHHWDMRTKFLEVRSKCMEKIIEDPCLAHCIPEEGVFIRSSLAMEEERWKAALAREGECMEKIIEDPCMAHCITEEGVFIRSSLTMEEERWKTALAREGEKYQENGSNVDGDNCDELVFEYQDFLSPKLSMLQEQQQLQKENICEQLDDAEDEKLKRESLQKGLDNETRTEALYPGLNVERKHYANNGNIEDLVVVGKSIQHELGFAIDLVNATQDSTFKVDSKMETENVEREFASELILEDINGKDFVPGVVLPSSCKLEHVTLKNSTNMNKAEVLTSKASGKLVKQQAVGGAKQQRILSRLQRLRRSIRTLFSCFRRNQVTPVEI